MPNINFGAPNVGVHSKFAVGDAFPIVNGAAGMLLNILSENVADTRGIIDGNALQGTRAHLSNQCREGLIMVGGSFACHPTKDDLQYLLKLPTGGTPSGGSYPFAETLPAFHVQKKLGTGGRVLSFQNLYANVATLSASRGQPLVFEMSLIGTSAPVENQTLAAGLSIRNRTTTPNIWVFHDMTMTIGSSDVYRVFDFSMSINNALDVQMVNSRTATAVFPTDRIVSFSIPMPEVGITLTNFQDVEVTDCVATFTNGAHILTITFYLARFATVTPVISSRGETRYFLNGIAYKDPTGAAAGSSNGTRDEVLINIA